MMNKQIANVYTPSPRRGLGVGVVVALLLCLFFAACSDEEQEYDPYYDWQARNEAWFRTVADSARAAIAEAKAQYGDQWQQHCQWRMMKRLDQAQDYDTGRTDDSICVRIAAPNEQPGDYSPTWSDTVRISYRGWMMPTVYHVYGQDGTYVDSLRQQVFDQTYYGAFDAQTAAPLLSPVSTFITGFYTALQYMVAGDDWYVYIPYRLAYGEEGTGSIPGYSTLLFRLHLAAVYPCNSGVPTWKAPRRLLPL